MAHGGGNKDKQLSFVDNFILGGLAAVISKTAAAPLERVKLLVQNQGEMLKYGQISEPYKGLWECTTRTYNTEGFWSFWRGNLANCIRYFPTQALNFSFKDKINAQFKTKKEDSYMLNLGRNVAAGGIAGGLSLCFVYSLDYARTRLGNDTKSAKNGGKQQYKGLADVYKQTYKSDGFAGLYRGFFISCVGIVAYRGVYFGFYDTLKPIMLGDNAGIVALFTLGYAVTVFAEMITYPIDTVRRRMMMTSGHAEKYKGAYDALTKIVQKEGAKALMHGAGANVLRGVAGAGVLAGFDKLKDWWIDAKVFY